MHFGTTVHETVQPPIHNTKLCAWEPGMNKDTTLLYKKHESNIIMAPLFISSLTYLTTRFAGEQPLTQAAEKFKLNEH